MEKGSRPGGPLTSGRPIIPQVTATALTHLTLNGCHLMQLTEADTAVLLALPRLQRLEIEGIRSAEPALIQQWQLRMPNLRIVPMPA